MRRVLQLTAPAAHAVADQLDGAGVMIDGALDEKLGLLLRVLVAQIFDLVLGKFGR